MCFASLADNFYLYFSQYCGFSCKSGIVQEKSQVQEKVDQNGYKTLWEREVTSSHTNISKHG